MIGPFHGMPLEKTNNNAILNFNNQENIEDLLTST